MNGGKDQCPVLKSQARALNWQKIVKSNADLARLVLALREQFYIAKTEGNVLRVSVNQGVEEDF
jgi:hypothetical protein